MSDTSNTGSLVLIPGLGADVAFYARQRQAFGDRLIVPQWIQPQHEDETLEHYAHRLARRIQELPNLRRPFFVGGVSLGGMLAAEIAECCGDDAAGLLLIAACCRRQQVTPLFRVVAAGSGVVPDGLIKGLLNHAVPHAIGWWQGLDPAATDLFNQSTFRTDIPLLKWGGRAIRRWQEPADPKCPVYLAHGRRDWVIPIPEDAMRPGVDLAIPDGRHLIHFTHASAVNRWIRQVMEQRPRG